MVRRRGVFVDHIRELSAHTQSVHAKVLEGVVVLCWWGGSRWCWWVLVVVLAWGFIE